jgi:hypothetical protein
MILLLLSMVSTASTLCAHDFLPNRHCDSFADCSGGQQCVSGLCVAPVLNLTVDECFGDDAQTACATLPGSLLACAFQCDCVAGSTAMANCSVLPSLNVTCAGPRHFQRPYRCRYCFDLDPEDVFCGPMYRDATRSTELATRAAANAMTASNRSLSLNVDRIAVNACESTSVQYYYAECSAKAHVLCLGSRHFLQRRRCEHVGEKRWLTATLLSVIVGGFGVDRFYLGSFGWGVFKLLSFGGVGVWTIVDAIAIATGYVTPADGSLFAP